MHKSMHESMHKSMHEMNKDNSSKKELSVHEKLQKILNPERDELYGG